MAKKFSELRAMMTPESQARAEAKAQAMLAEMPLNELRQARGLSQKMLAEVGSWARTHPADAERLAAIRAAGAETGARPAMSGADWAALKAACASRPAGGGAEGAD